MMRGRGEWRKEKKKIWIGVEYCVLFFWRLASALSLFCAKAKQSFSAWYKKAGRERNRKGVGGKKNRLLGSRLPRVPVSRIESGLCFFVQEWAGRGLFVCYTMGRAIRRDKTIGDAEGEGKEGWAMQIGINAMHS
jgi:hypothetical protein